MPANPLENTPPIPPLNSRSGSAPRRRLRTRKLHFARPDIGREEIQAVTRVLKSGWLTSGPETLQFEQEFARAVGAAEAVAVNSCTAALHLALAGWNLGPDDAVLVPALTFTASAEIVEYSGSLPIILDVNRETYLMDAEIVEDFIRKSCDYKKGALIHRASKKRIRAILPVHLGGRPCEMDELLALAKRYRLKVLEDAAHAFPATYNSRPIGAIGDATAFSFYATKNLTTGEGGMLTTNNKRLADRARRMRLHGIKGQTYGRKRWHYDVVDRGFKYNMSDINAALGRVQLERSEDMLAHRRNIHAHYDRALADIPGLRLNPTTPHSSSHHLYTLEIVSGKKSGGRGVSRDRFVEEMFARNIAVSLHFIPLYRLSHYRKTYGLKAKDYPNSEAIYRNIVSLPVYSAMSASDAADVTHAIRESLL
ncbi:MAG: DegT/DnrJ/EryC1/StrS family aminotransferase [bacterium]|nr:DegT/DnrJ/EryC1/StrS family aminotransferase [bacterium]